MEEESQRRCNNFSFQLHHLVQVKTHMDYSSQGATVHGKVITQPTQIYSNENHKQKITNIQVLKRVD